MRTRYRGRGRQSSLKTAGETGQNWRTSFHLKSISSRPRRRSYEKLRIQVVIDGNVSDLQQTPDVITIHDPIPTVTAPMRLQCVMLAAVRWVLVVELGSRQKKCCALAMRLLR